MLENLKLQDLFQKFFDNCIRVSFLQIFGALLSDAGIYHINYGVTRGFRALRKAVNNTLGKISYFFAFVWYCQSAADTHSPFAPLGQVDEWTAKPSPFSIQGCLSGCVRIMAAYRQWRSNFPRRERKPKYGKKTDSYVFSGFVYGISRGWEQKSTTGQFVTGRFWPCTWKIYSVGEDQVNNWEFCTLNHRLFL